MGFLYSQLFVTPPKPFQEFRDQTIVVTGSNIGLGLEAARWFVQLGCAKLIIACRDVTKVRAAKLDRLDIVCANAGVASTDYVRTEDNENMITVNVVSTFLLGLLLIPIMRETGVRYNILPKVVITSSGAHSWAKFDERHSANIFDTLNDEKTANMADRYPVSKLLEVLLVRELALHLDPNAGPVLINCVSPGLCYSALIRDLKGIKLTAFKLFMSILARTTEVGSRTIVAGATAGVESHGKYMKDGEVAEPSPFVQSEEGRNVGHRIYAELKAKLEKIEPGITKNI